MKIPHGVTLVLSNVDIGDTTFDSTEGSWNVTRALRDCRAGKHKLYNFDVPEVVANSLNVEVDDAKVKSMVLDRKRLAQSPPPIFAMEGGKLWLIDGHHRLRALHELREPHFVAYVIEEEDGAPYRIYFNGARVAPWFNQEETNDTTDR